MDKPVIDSTTILCQVDVLIHDYELLRKNAVNKYNYIYYGGAIDALKGIRNKIVGSHQPF